PRRSERECRRLAQRRRQLVMVVERFRQPGGGLVLLRKISGQVGRLFFGSRLRFFEQDRLNVRQQRAKLRQRQRGLPLLLQLRQLRLVLVERLFQRRPLFRVGGLGLLVRPLFAGQRRVHVDFAVAVEEGEELVVLALAE